MQSPTPPSEDGDAEDDLQPPLHRAELPAAVVHERGERERRNEAEQKEFEPRIDAHVHAHRLALEHLASAHQAIADHIDLDLTGDTRHAAIWQMAGRCLGFGHQILDSLQLGYTVEVEVTARALHETTRLLGTFFAPGEDQLVRTWLKDKRAIKPSHTRKAEQRFDAGLSKALQEKGMPPFKGDREQKSRKIYALMSEGAHHRRSRTQVAVDPLTRTMTFGRSTRWRERARATGSWIQVVEESIIEVTAALALYVSDPGWYEDTAKPYMASFAALRQTHPLPGSFT